VLRAILSTGAAPAARECSAPPTSTTLRPWPAVKISNFKDSNGGRPQFSKRVSRYISATVRPIAAQYGMMIHIDPFNPTGRYNFEFLKIQDSGRKSYWMLLNYDYSAIDDRLTRNSTRWRLLTILAPLRSKISKLWTVQVIVPRRNWTRLTDMVDELHRSFSSAVYVFRNNYYFLEQPAAPNETSNITFLRHRQKVTWKSN